MDMNLKGIANMSNLFYPTVDNQALVSLQPDPDHIKMFVGQIPKSYNESNLMQMFEKFGKVYELILIKDNLTKKSKGCCFVTYFTRQAALDAQNALHNVTVLPGMIHPVQMKPADTDQWSGRKVFIGMLPKNFSEDEVRNLFSPYGSIEECVVLRDLSGKSKRCAFVTYLSRYSALNAVISMHHSFMFKGCSSPIVVKISDSHRDKERRITAGNSLFEQSLISGFEQEQSTTPNNVLASAVFPNNSSQPLQQYDVRNSNIEDTLLGYSSPTNSHVHILPLLSNPQCNNMIEQLTKLSLLKSINSRSINNASGLKQNYYLNRQLHNLSVFQTMDLPNETDILNNLLASLDYAVSQGLAYFENDNLYLHPNFNDSVDRLMISQKQIEGPEGANLFIYHLPRQFTDQNLYELFSPFGNVISTKVFIDKATKLSKGFGFVSYDNVDCANRAIQNLNGYYILGKKLKVEVKKKKITLHYPS